jgi:hypothetical protein
MVLFALAPEFSMKKLFTAPVLTAESTLSALTLTGCATSCIGIPI